MLLIFPGTVRVLVSNQSRVPGLAFSRWIKSLFGDLEGFPESFGAAKAPVAIPRLAAAAPLIRSRRYRPRLESFELFIVFSYSIVIPTPPATGPIPSPPGNREVLPMGANPRLRQSQTDTLRSRKVELIRQRYLSRAFFLASRRFWRSRFLAAGSLGFLAAGLLTCAAASGASGSYGL